MIPQASGLRDALTVLRKGTSVFRTHIPRLLVRLRHSRAQVTRKILTRTTGVQSHSIRDVRRMNNLMSCGWMNRPLSSSTTVAEEDMAAVRGDGLHGQAQDDEA